MAGPYSDGEKKKYLEQVINLLGQGYSLNAACRQVAERNDGRPSATSLTKWAKTAGLGNDAGPFTTAATTEELGRSEGEDSAYRPIPSALEKVDAGLERQPGSVVDVLDGGTLVPLDTAHAERRPDQGAERDGDSVIAADPAPENDAHEQAVHRDPEPATNNAGSESVQLSSTVSAVDMAEDAEVVRERTPRLRAMVTTMSERIRALGNRVKVFPGR